MDKMVSIIVYKMVYNEAEKKSLLVDSEETLNLKS